MARRLLVSAPGDVPVDDVDCVFGAVNRWNVIYGEQLGAVVVPTHWKLHSTAEHGDRPQSALNTQLVETADILVALFWHRLGSATGEAESGTVEEIETAHANGSYVGILRCTRAYPQTVDPEQLQRLQAFYGDLESRSLMLDYDREADLGRHVDAILSQAVTRDAARAEAAMEVASHRAEVWPRVESSERTKTDSKGRIKTTRRWQLVLANTGAEAARNVRYRLETENESDDLPIDPNDDPPLEVLAPRGEAAYVLMLHMGVASQVRCVVAWEDTSGNHENQATLRFH